VDGAPNSVTLETHHFEDLAVAAPAHHGVGVPVPRAIEMAMASGMTHGIYESMDRMAELLPTL